jgi:hypothetical protein
MHCINKSHFEVKNLAEKLGDSLDVTAAKIAIWQEDNEEYNRFPTYEELNEEGDLSTMYNNAVEQLESFNTKDAGVFSKDTFSLSELKKEYPLLSISIEKSGNSIKANATFKKVVDKAANKLKQLEDSKRTREYESLKRRDTSEESLLSVQDYKPTHNADPLIQQKYFSTGRTQKSSDVLQKIIEINPEYAKIAEKLLPLVKSINDVDIILRPTKSLQTSGELGEARGFYSRITNTIEIAQHAKHYQRRSEGLIVHEILHAISHKLLTQTGEINQDFKRAYDKAVSVLGTYNPSTKEGLYGTYNIDEFFVALFTDAKLIKALENIEPVNIKAYKNLFEELFDIILRALNFKTTDNLYSQAFAIATNIVDPERIEREEQEFRIQAELERDAFEADMQINQGIYDEMFAQQKEFLSIPDEIKPGVLELFESNPELASAVYEALGFDKKNNTVRLYRIENKNIPYDESREGIVSKKEIVGGFFTDNIDTVTNYIRKNQSQEGINLVYVDISKNDLDKYHVSKNEYAKTMDVESDNWIIPSDINRSYVDLSSLSKVTGNLMTLSKAKQELKSIIDNLPTSQITPQQKQQAQQLYSQYLDTIFPDSKVKDIVYHGTNTKFDTFNKSNLPDSGIYFEKNKMTAYEYGNVLIPAILNSSGYYYGGNLNKVNSKQIRENGETGLTNSSGNIVFEPEQIHILGNKQDVEGFRDYITEEQNLPKFKPVGYKHKAHQLILDNLSQIKGWEKQIKDPNILYRKIQELGIPKSQMELFVNSDGNTVEEKLLSFLSNYSYTIEINVAKEEKTSVASDQSGNSLDKLTKFKLGDITYVTDGWDLQYFSYDSNNNITNLNRNQFNAALEQFKLKNTKETPTQYYSNLTVPGGTNYTENEIATPQIIPSIKGHGQFATDNGIGWFRSDEQVSDKIDNPKEGYKEDIQKDSSGYTEFSGYFVKGSKTRRILEVQSDLFQKGRDKQSLTTKVELENSEFNASAPDWMGDDLLEQKPFIEKDIKGNQFLQLLNKDNNWVTFFVKSIIQDSAKKGYEKVLFPSGNTASKVEGHESLEEFKKQKEDIIIRNEKRLNSYSIKPFNNKGFKIFVGNAPQFDTFKTKEEAEQKVKEMSADDIKEINQLKKELERVEREGFGALKPIYNFYENNVANVLKKQGYKPVVITDEYGNTWNEVELDEERDLEDIKFKVRPRNTLNNIEKEKFKKSISPGDKATFKHWNEDSSVVEEFVDINIGDVFDDDFEGYYNEDNKQKFKYENVISNERPNKYDIEEQAIFKNKLYVGASVVFYVDNIKIEGNVTEVGSSMFSVAVGDEIKTFEYADIDAENYERNISELVYGVKEVLRKQLKAFSKKVNTEEQVQRLASVEKALFQLENYKGIDDLLGFMDTVKKSISKSNALLNNLEKKDLPVDKKLAMMSYVKDYIKSFDIMKQLASQINKLDGSEKLKGVSNALLTELTLTEENYYDRVIPELAEWLWSVFPENLNKELLMTKQKPWTKERLIQELRSPSGDLDFLNTYLVPTTNANDVITGLFAKILKRALDAGRYAVYQMEQAIKPAFKKVQDRFGDMNEVYKNFYTIKDLKVMENGEEKTKKVRYIIEQYNLQEYYDTIRNFKNQTNDLWKAFKETDDKAKKSAIKAEIDKVEKQKLQYQKSYGKLVTASKMKSDMEALRDKNSPKFNYDLFGNYLSYFYKITAFPSQNSLEVVDEETGEVTYYEYKENRWNPDKSKFETDEYKKLASGDEDIFNLYKEYKKIYDDLERMLPESRKMRGLIPCHYEDKAVVNVGKWWKNLTTTTDKQYLSTLGGEVYRQIPIGYSRPLDISQSSDDIMSSLMKYSLEVHHFKAKNDILGGVDGITAVLEKYKPFDPTQQSKTKSELNNRRDAIKKFIKQVFYNETRASDAWYDKAIDFFAKGTSIMRMAIKPSNAIANIIIGNYANFSEAYGGRNFTTKDLLKAEKDYFHLIATNPQKLANMLNTLDAIQGRYNIEVGQTFRSAKSKFTIDNVFILQDLGEHQIQGVAMLALLEAKKVPIPEDGNFDLSTLPDNFIDTLHELNKANHGVYNQFDRLYMQDQALFRLFLQFRKWIIPTFRSRWSGFTEDWRNPQGTNKYRIDIESGTVEAGYYRMFFGFIGQYLKDLKRIPNIIQDAKNLDPIAKEGVKRTLRDGASLLAITALFLPLAGADDDEWVNEEHSDIVNWIHWEIIYQLERLRADIALFIPFIGFKDEMRIVNQPFAAASTAVQMYELASMMFDIEEREDGTYGWAQYKRDYGRYEKGDLKMWSRVSKLDPSDNPLEDLRPDIQYKNFKSSSNA